VSDKVVPISTDAVIAFDTERELIEFFVTHVKGFIDGAGLPPTRVALALMGKGNDGKFHTRAKSWDTREESSRIENCSVAAALFLHRATADD
jgi:hypothetical protein